MSYMIFLDMELVHLKKFLIRKVFYANKQELAGASKHEYEFQYFG